MIPLYSLYKESCGIYGIKNRVDSRIYIGSSTNIGRRPSYHKRVLNEGNHFNPHLQHAWNKYGDSNFTLFILEYCDKELLAEREEFYIKSYRLVYNIDKEIIRHVHTKEVIERIAEKNRGQKRTVYTKKLLSEIAKNRKYNPMEGVHRYGEEAPMYGKKHSEESKLKMSITKINNNKGKAILVFYKDHISEYSSAIQASKDLRIPQQNIYGCLNGQRKSAKGYKFKYK